MCLPEKWQDFNTKWQFVKGYVPSLKVLQMYGKKAQEVTLPHDAMRSEPRTKESVSEGNSGWYLGGDYEYTKHVFVPSEYSGKKVLIEFESVYHNAEVYINGKKAAYRPYGYTNFYVDTEGFLKYEAQNEIRVIARNSDQPNSRWYSGDFRRNSV